MPSPSRHRTSPTRRKAVPTPKIVRTKEMRVDGMKKAVPGGESSDVAGRAPRQAEGPPGKLDAGRTKQLASNMATWFPCRARDLPWRRTLDPYGIWISEIMLQQTQVKTVIPYWERWMHQLPNLASLAEAPPDLVLKLWEGLGYYSRARNLQAAARRIQEEHGGVFPKQFEAVLDLPGIGRYTAGAICSIAYNDPTPILDGNLVRVITRVFTIEGDPRTRPVQERLWEIAGRLVGQAAQLPPAAAAHSGLIFAGNCSILNQSLMELGALICTPTAPRCEECPVRKLCAGHCTGTAEHYPQTAPRTETVRQEVAAFLLRRENQIWIRRRPAGTVNAGFWELPNGRLEGRQKPQALLLGLMNLSVRRLDSVAVVRHTITHHRIKLTVWAADCPTPMPELPGEGRWVSLEELGTLPVVSAHRKALRELKKTG